MRIRLAHVMAGEILAGLLSGGGEARAEGGDRPVVVTLPLLIESSSGDRNPYCAFPAEVGALLVRDYNCVFVERSCSYNIALEENHPASDRWVSNKLREHEAGQGVLLSR